VHDRLLQELRTLHEFDAEAIAALPYLDACCREALRIHPVAPMIGRQLRQELTLHGYRLPAGTGVGVSVLLVHRRADLYPEPERYLPERFLQRSFTPFEYLPFGGGARRCLGAAFATYELKIALAQILRHHPLRLLDTGPSRPQLRHTTVAPRGGVRMVRA
jgi:cytochrome P450